MSLALYVFYVWFIYFIFVLWLVLCVMLMLASFILPVQILPFERQSNNLRNVSFHGSLGKSIVNGIMGFAYLIQACADTLIFVGFFEFHGFTGLPVGSRPIRSAMSCYLFSLFLFHGICTELLIFSLSPFMVIKEFLFKIFLSLLGNPPVLQQT